jgi:FkbM family methyltransferase
MRRALRLKSAIRLTAGITRIRLRPCDSDPFVALQIFGDREYDLGPIRTRTLRDLAETWRVQGLEPVILDAGANVGYSALFFAETFPNATVLAIEPDQVTFCELQRNCAGVPNIQPIRAALWSHEDGVTLHHNERLKSWATSVRDGGLTPSVRLDTLMASVPNSRPLILKFDIEGAEREVIAAAARIVRDAACILIEPHDLMQPGHGCIAPLLSALAGKRMDTTVLGENLAFFESDLLGASAPAP